MPFSLGTPVEVFDPATNEVFYILSAEQFQKLSRQPSEDSDPRGFYPLIDPIMLEDDSHDLLLESYQ
jgi:hypothetical protein